MLFLRYAAIRLARAVPMVILIVVVNFFLVRLAPGDVVDFIMGQSGVQDAAYANELREKFGMDRPLLTQFFSYAQDMLRLNLGWSHRYNQPVATLVFDRLLATALLASIALAIAVVVGCLLGRIAGTTRARWLDTLISVASTIVSGLPVFWLSLMMIVLFSVTLKWLPSSGFSTIGDSIHGFERVLDVGRHLILPATSLAAYYVVVYIRLSRSAVVEIVGNDFIRTARAKGLSRGRIIRGHIWPNALLPVLTITSVEAGALLGGAVTVETVFGWPGLGQLMMDAIMSRDLNILVGMLFLSSIAILTINILTDLLYVGVDPRISLRDV